MDFGESILGANKIDIREKVNMFSFFSYEARVNLWLDDTINK
jgi:hypothetical protein